MNKDRLRRLEKFSIAFTLIAGVFVGLGQFMKQSSHLIPETDRRLRTLKGELPKKIDDITTMVDLNLAPTGATFWYVVDFSVHNKPKEPHELEQSAQREICANTDMSRLIKKHGHSYEFHYASRAGVSLADFTIASCP
jgi:hypothetical protein